MDRNRIKERRLALGYTQTDIGDKLGVGKATIQKYESGAIKSIDSETCAKLSKILQCSAAYLLGLTDDVNGINTANGDLSQLIEKYKSSAGTRTLFSALKTASEDDLQNAVEYIEFLKHKKE